MIGNLDGKTAIVTGAASGIGLGMVRAFSEAGMKIAMVDIDTAKLAEASERLTEQGAEVLPLSLDVADYLGWVSAAERIEAELGPPQLVCNNAGVGLAGLTLDALSPAVWNRFVEINLNGVFNALHCLSPRMEAAGGGHFVNTASIGGLIAGRPGLGPYAATKHAVVALSEAVRLELAPRRIGVSVLCPGAVQTMLWRTSRVAGGLPETDIPSPEYLRGSASPTGLDPYLVGLRVVQAVQNNEFYIITHPEYRIAFQNRIDDIANAFDLAETHSHK